MYFACIERASRSGGEGVVWVVAIVELVEGMFQRGLLGGNLRFASELGKALRREDKGLRGMGIAGRVRVEGTTEVKGVCGRALASRGHLPAFH